MQQQQLDWHKHYRFADSVVAPSRPFYGSHLPMGSAAAVIVAPAPAHIGTSTVLYFTGELPTEPVQGLRITFAVNVREEVELEAFLYESGDRLGLFDVRYAYAKQMFEIPVTLDGGERIFREGVGLRMIKGTEDAWLLCGEGEDCAVFSPHLLLAPAHAAADRLALFSYHLQSQACYHRSGWMEGCVLDGLYDMYRFTKDTHYLLAVEQHLKLFVDDNKEIEEPTGPRVKNGKIVADVIEQTLPYAVLAKIQPDHPVIDSLIAYWLDYQRADGSIYDRETDTITGEGVYTVGYPIAAIAAARGRDDLAELALMQLWSRKERLVTERGIYLRADAENHCSYLNWARALAWYLLGAARTLIELKAWNDNKPSTLYKQATAEFARAAGFAASFQQADGLWTVFADDSSTGTEAGGAAGIAAAMVLGAREGLLEDSYLIHGERAWIALQEYLTIDGFITGVSQTNQGGEELQRSGYRVMFQMGMGLLAQLGAALHKPL
ncbi:glycoside hydrolase family 88 protein [Paenibacillus periandrae]|uniref:glycoside hydrolase family 88 protein n=1 Tax=Paenibacillus periandrae TaxID=1761741 RepID=UPI001F09EB9F|nr:glycoside hydrolase family 88 protein [Paenibacillus periandrae]